MSSVQRIGLAAELCASEQVNNDLYQFTTAQIVRDAAAHQSCGVQLERPLVIAPALDQVLHLLRTGLGVGAEGAPPGGCPRH